MNFLRLLWHRVTTGLAPHLWPLAVANIVANIGIVVTGAAVRLTGSGLGCPTWPRCTDDSYVAHPSMGMHGAIEFGNRMLTWVLVLLAVLLVLSAVGAARRTAIWFSLFVALGIPAQAVIGGITVLTDLNPWIVALHLLVSMAIIMVCLALLDHLRSPSRPAGPPTHRALGWTVLVVGWVVLYLGTVVTGAGPHAGDADAPRSGLDPALFAQVHAVSVYVLVAATVALLVLAVRSHDRWLTVVTSALLGLEVLQGIIGWSQYFLDLNEWLVALHMLMAALLAAGFARVWLATRPHSASEGDATTGRLLAWASGQQGHRD